MEDPLTGAWSQADWPRLVQETSSQAATGGRGAWAALIDIDHFKRFNMHNGHLAGDAVLVKLAGFLRSLGKVQVVRSGGGEFALVGLHETAQGGRATCERVLVWARDSLTPEQEQHCGQKDCVGPTDLTVSIGVGRIEPAESATSVRERLEATLGAAKRRGRDRIESG